MHVGTTAHHVGFLGCRQSLREEVLAKRSGRNRRSPLGRRSPVQAAGEQLEALEVRYPATGVGEEAHFFLAVCTRGARVRV